jgi:hypothetical protein
MTEADRSGSMSRRGVRVGVAALVESGAVGIGSLGDGEGLGVNDGSLTAAVTWRSTPGVVSRGTTHSGSGGAGEVITENGTGVGSEPSIAASPSTPSPRVGGYLSGSSPGSSSGRGSFSTGPILFFALVLCLIRNSLLFVRLFV